MNTNIVVTAYYIINNKRPSSDFNEWIKNFMHLKILKVIYTDKNKRIPYKDFLNQIKETGLTTPKLLHEGPISIDGMLKILGEHGFHGGCGGGDPAERDA